jgi:hypothetical protein
MIRPFSSMMLAGAALALSACASDTTHYPSLAKREAERIANSAPSAPSPTPAPLPAAPAATLASLDGLIARAKDAHRRFAARRPRAEQLVAAAAGAPLASESWSVASIALADLESARSDTMVALAELDGAYAAARVAGSDVTAISAAREDVMALVGEEDRVLAALRRRIAG